MLRTVIVDDERLARRELRALLDRIDDVEIMGEAGSVPEARALLSRLQPDVVLLDIRLGRASGFDLLETIADECAVIFVTAYDEHAIRAFDVNALDYLVKPVEPARLRRALERVGGRRSVPALAQSWNGRLETTDWLFLPVGERRTFLKLRDITHLEADGDYVLIHATDGRMIRSNTSMASWEARLPNGFLRIHRQSIVNLDFVANIEPWSHYSYQVWLRGLKKPLSMSRRYALKAKSLLG